MEMSSESRCSKPARIEKWPREGLLVCSVEEFILEHENKNTAQKTERDVRLLERFLKTKDEDRKIEDIPAAELNEFISEFIISVPTKIKMAKSTSRLRFEV